MHYTDLTSRRAVLSTIAECDRLGRDAFLTKYGYAPAKEYVLRHGGREYDSKAIVGVAYGHQHGCPPLKPSDFSGGRGFAAGHLVKLGFEVDGVSPDPRHWSLDEVTATVEDYFDMYRAEMAGTPYNKAQHNEALRKRLNSRTKSSVELKHQNISAILQDMGLRWLGGYLPRGNTQLLLKATVTDFVDQHPELFDIVKQPASAPAGDAIVSAPAIDQVQRVAKARRGVRIDFAECEARNRELGRAGEKWALQLLRSRLEQDGRADLAQRVRLISDEIGDGLGYDIESFDKDGQALYVEVKTTNGPITAPFLISANEVLVSEELGNRYVILRVFDFASAPRAYTLRGSVKETCQLTPQVYKALPATQVTTDNTEVEELAIA
ncbi:MAG TPA: DUF3883 domain-containing protein [Azospirillum sp.]|nr:DUF3883 domain-containing protein [Azospirillum sp.]